MLSYEIIKSKLNKVKTLDEELVCSDIETMSKDYGLTMTQKTTLSTKKGSYHWHFKKGKEKGILEVTYWPKKSQLWIDIHDNRRAGWNVEIIEQLADSFTQYFGGSVIKHT